MENPNMSVSEANAIIQKTHGFICERIKDHQIPGSGTNREEGKDSFHIPRYKFYRDYLGWSDKEIDEYHRSMTFAQYKKDPLL